MGAAQPIFIALHSLRKVLTLPVTFAYLLEHILRAHQQVILWKSADPPVGSADITQFGWKCQNNIPTPTFADGEPAPPKLIDV